MSQRHKWVLAIRPKTLSISVAPVCVGTALARAEGEGINWLVAAAALVAAVLIQIGTNLYNDAADFERGADTPERVGPERATAEGWFSAREVKQGALLAFTLAFALGIYLAWIGGWPIVLLGLFSLAAGYAYTGGPKPIAYSASGELFVFLFFGLAAVLGSYYLQRFQLSAAALMSACSVGLMASAVLLVNNYRDLETDQRAHKLTLVHYLGRPRSRLLYAALLLLPFTLPMGIMHIAWGSWIVLVVLPWALGLLKRFMAQPVGPEFNSILADTAKLQLAYSLLLSVGLGLS